MLGIDQSTGEPTFSMPDGVPGRVSSPDRFEFEQLMNAGALQPSALPSFPHSLEENFEIVLNTNAPPFLAGLQRTKRTAEPTHVGSNPEGSLARAARDAAHLSRERLIRHFPTGGLLDDDPPPVIPTVPLSDLPEWKQQTFGSFGPRHERPATELPIAQWKGRICEMVANHRVFLLIGETGCGKTTQLPQFLLELGITDRQIAMTQPRRVAAISVAKRVAAELGGAIGGTVGYAVRFEECTSAAPRIRFVTDGMLLKECLGDRRLSRYGVVVLDEAHERTIHTDVLFGLVKKILADSESNLRVIVASATLQQQKFSEFFGGCPILEIPGRAFPVQASFAARPFPDYLQAAVQAVVAIHRTEPLPGDVLLFLTGQEDIDAACELLYAAGRRLPGELIVLPIYSTLPTEQQSLIFEATPPGSRKVVVATNIAETSHTCTKGAMESR